RRGSAGLDPARPVEAVCRRMAIAFVAVSASAGAPEHATREPALEIGAIHELQRAGKGDPAFGRRDVAGTEPLELVGERGLQPARARREIMFQERSFRT